MCHYEKDLDIYEPKNVVNYLINYALLSEVNDGSLNDSGRIKKYLEEIRNYANSHGKNMDIQYSSNDYNSDFGSMYFIWDANQLSFDEAHKYNKKILEAWRNQESKNN